MKSERILKKVCSVILAAAMISSGTAVALPFSGGAGSIVASAAEDLNDPDDENESQDDTEITISDNDDGSVTITRYSSSASEITIPSEIDGKKVTGIGDYAFDWDSKAVSITISESVTNIGRYAFIDCSTLKEIKVNSNNENYSSVDGVLYNKDKTELILCPKGYSGELNIPDSVTSIDEYAFCYCTSLENITIPKSVTSIGNYAFSGCTSLASITIPSSVTSIGYRAFFSGSNLKEINVDVNNKNYSSVDGVFYNKDKTELILCPAGYSGDITISDSVTSIDEYAFYYCRNLASITIPDSVTSIEKYGFYHCEKLIGVTIPDGVTSIGSFAFSGCTSLGDVTIPDSVTSIGEYAFSNCTSLPDVTIPDSVTSISDGLFFDCTSIESITIPESVTRIGECAFCYCTDLAEVTIKGKNITIGMNAFYDTAWYNNLPDGSVYIGDIYYTYKGTMPENTIITMKEDTVSVAEYALSSQKNLVNVEMPETVTDIGYRSFSSCTSLTEVDIPENIKSIGEAAFAGDTKIEKVNIPKTAEKAVIGANAFYDCPEMKSITLPDTVVAIGEKAFGYYYYYDRENGTIYQKVPQFTIYGKTDSDAYRYAAANEFIFIDIDTGEVALYPTEISISDLPPELKRRDSVTLTAKVTAEDGADKTVTWISSDENVATVDENGKVTAVAAGEALITAKTVNGLTSSILITVTKPEIIFGDTNGDGMVNIADALMIARADAGLVELTEEQIAVSDVNHDEKVNIADALMVSRYDAGLITGFDK